MYQTSTTPALDGLVQLVLAPKLELDTPMSFFRILVPTNPGQLVRKPPKLGSVSVAASNNQDVPKKYHTSLGWLGLSSKS